MARFNINDYEMVKDRIPLFYETHEDGRICTEVISETLDRVTVKAYLYKSLEEQVSCAPLSTGIAMENEVPPDEKGVHKYYENCETSAIGRALANLDMYDKTKDRASKEEMIAAELMDRSGGSQTSGSEPSSPPKLNNPGGTPSPRQTNYIRAFADAGILVKEEYFDENDNILLTAQGASDILDVVFKGGAWNKFEKENPEKATEIKNKYSLRK